MNHQAVSEALSQMAASSSTVPTMHQGGSGSTSVGLAGMAESIAAEKGKMKKKQGSKKKKDASGRI